MSSPNSVRIFHPYRLGLLLGLGALTAIGLANALTSIASIITSIITALFIALGLEPLIQILQKRVKKRSYAISIVALALVGLITLVFVLVLPPLVTEASGFIKQLPDLLKAFVQLPWVHALDDRFGGTISTALNDSGGFLVNSNNWPNLLGGVVQVGISLFNGVIGFITVCILTLYFMSSLHSIKSVTINLIAKSHREKATEMIEQVISSVGRYVMGQVTIASINASYVFTVLLISGMKYAVVLAFIDFLFVLIPIIGSMTGGLIIIAVSAATMPSGTTLAIAIALVCYIQIEAYLISPRIMKRAVNVPAALVVVSALAGGALLGVLGALLAIPVAATLLLVIREVWVPRQNRK